MSLPPVLGSAPTRGSHELDAGLTRGGVPAAPRVAAEVPTERAGAGASDERTDAVGSRDRATPPDFGLLLARLAVRPNRATEPAPDAAQPAPRPDAAVDADASLDRVAAEAMARALLLDSTMGRPVEAVARRTAGPGLLAGAMADPLTDPLADPLADPVAGAAARAVPGGRSADALARAIDRARRREVGELLARGDRRAADVRSALDTLLDTAGTERGRALAETARPVFADAVAASAADPTTAVRDTAALAPEFRARLERVIDRMRDEHGHDVQVVETVRSTERQAHLYAQGRSRPGPVVTWTLDSAHLGGEAADVVVDGRWHHPQGYARLHAIAAEEGLETLGMRDPGHLELRGSAVPGEHAAAHTHGRGPVAAPGQEAVGPSGVPGGATVAPVAAVASVAAVARVAAVAGVARPGAMGPARRVERVVEEPALGAPVSTDGQPSPAARTAAAPIAAEPSRQETTGSAGDGAPRERGASDDRGARRVSVESLPAVGTLAPDATRVLEPVAPRQAAPAGSEAALRVEQIAALREDAPARALSSLTLQLDTPEGLERVHVHLRGGVVGADVQTPNASLVDRLRLQTADLQDALGRHGLEADTVRVQQSARGQEADAARLALADRGDVLKAAGATSGQSSWFEQGTRDRQPSRSAERDARDPQDDSPNQRRRDDRQEQR